MDDSPGVPEPIVEVDGTVVAAEPVVDARAEVVDVVVALSEVAVSIVEPVVVRLARPEPVPDASSDPASGALVVLLQPASIARTVAAPIRLAREMLTSASAFGRR